MSSGEKLKQITNENRAAILGGLTADELKETDHDTWLTVFKELKTLWASDISLKQKREITRQIYPAFNFESKELDKFKFDTQQTFNGLMNSPVFLHAIHQWQHSSIEQRPEISKTLAREVMSQMNEIEMGRLTTFNEYKEEGENATAFISPTDMQDIIHLNTNPKIFEQRTLPSVLRTLHHESTHLVQKHQVESRPELSAPYFDSNPEDKTKESLKKDGYIFNDDDTKAYTHHPEEIEAYFKGNTIQELMQTELEKGLGKGMMKNPYNYETEEENFTKNPTVLLGGTTEDLNPYRHLFAGIKSAKKVLSSPIPKVQEAGDCIKHFSATLKYGEFLEHGSDSPNPAYQMLSSLSYYMKQPRFQKVLKDTGFEKMAKTLLDDCSKSQNPAIKSKAKMVIQVKKLEAEQTSQNPIDKHNAIDIRDAFRDRKPLDEIKSDQPNTHETEREKRQREIMEQMMGIKKNFSL